MLEHEFPQLTFGVSDGIAKLVGPVSVNIGKRYEIIRTAEVRVEFPAAYPNSEPDGFIAKGTFAPHPGKLFADRHMSKGGWCCLELPAESSWDPKDPDGLRKWLTNFVLFIHRQFLYDINGGKWPGPEWEHGARGWAQFVRRNLDKKYWPIFIDIARSVPGLRRQACPCGSGKSFAQCHKHFVDEFMARLPHDPKLYPRVAALLAADLKTPAPSEKGVIDGIQARSTTAVAGA
jgi:hypothetical protein